ncbi:MAG TPA: class I SAM-dependent methyltransferase [Gammaproteobacteria bacterium]|nr:class I SAM-dependent methyltransferase [Gammaproteobacteria bacterium]
MFFKHQAESYERDTHRVANVENIANAILNHIHFEPDMHIMDFGSGTGLLLEKIAPAVGRISAVDISTSMNEQLDKKRPSLDCELEIIELDLSQANLDKKFDGIISSMTMHHIKDIKAMLTKFHAMLNSGGFIAIADLETEDGSFHTEDTGVFHFGFSREALLDLAKGAGFSNVEVTPASTVHKPQGDYPVLLLTGTA